MSPAQLFVGLMSGTSADGIDAALVAFEASRFHLLATHSHSFATGLKQDIHALTLPAENELGRMAELDHLLGEAFAEATLQLLAKARVAPDKISAIGSHGQTVRHQAGLGGERRFTLQIANPHLIAQHTGITTIADFRRRDIACGGQGAPLAPGFHREYFSSTEESRCVVNIGGIANITCLPVGGPATGFDTGPGNTLLDAWIHRSRGEAYDADGAWAASGKVNHPLLQAMLQHPYLARPAPKSTGREDFNLTWLSHLLQRHATSVAGADIQATLLEFTAITIAEPIKQHCPANTAVYVCGGGAHNGQMLDRLAHYLPQGRVATTEALGLDPDWVEAVAFAWLAKCYQEGKPGNLPAVTGATTEAVLGAAFPAGLSKK